MAVERGTMEKERAFPQLIIVFSLMIVLILIANTVIGYIQDYGRPIPLSFPPGVGAITAPSGELIGVSNGNVAFDVNRSDGTLKQQASIQLENGNRAEAIAFWRQALATDTSDAEADIYLEDQQVLASNAPYITFVVGLMLTGNASDIAISRDILQGAYVAQKEYNDGLKLGGSRQIRLLIANAGSQVTYTTSVAQQIVSIASKQDHSVVGVLGWPSSYRTLAALAILAKAGIPMVSPAASADELTNISPFFFRVVPSNNYQAIVGAKYAEQQLHAKRIVIFEDPGNSYSNSLGSNFARQFSADQIVFREFYIIGQKQDLPALLRDALERNPDLIYFAGYPSDLATLLINLPASQSNLQIMGGDALYQLQSYPSSVRPSFSRLHFTSFFYPDEWNFLGLSAKKPAFFSEYSVDFDPGDQHPVVYGFSRADSDAALAYDATAALLQGYKIASPLGTTLITPEKLRQGLARITGTQAFQGVSGQISFGNDGNPINKAIVILHGDQQGSIQMAGIVGCFQVAMC